MASIDDYKGMTYSILDRRHIKKLLGAMSNMYDRQLEKSGVDPKDHPNLYNEIAPGLNWPLGRATPRSLSQQLAQVGQRVRCVCERKDSQMSLNPSTTPPPVTNIVPWQLAMCAFKEHKTFDGVNIRDQRALEAYFRKIDEDSRKCKVILMFLAICRRENLTTDEYVRPDRIKKWFNKDGQQIFI
jgi:hypothetical protein